MKLLMLIKDKEYCNALAKGIALSSKEIKITILPFATGKDLNIEQYNLVLTDGDVTDYTRFFDKEEMRKYVFLVNYLKEDTVYKYENCIDEFSNYNFLFKYKEIRFFISDLLWYYYQVTSLYSCHHINGTMITFFSDKNILECTSYSKMLGRNITDRTNKKVLLFPLTYINTDTVDDSTVDTNFKKLVYNINLSRKFPLEPYFYMDIYGLYHFRSREILNPIPELFLEELNALIAHLMKNMFDVVIFDIGSNFSGNNLDLIRISDRRIAVIEEKNDLLLDIISKKCDLDDGQYTYKILIGKGYNKEQKHFDIDKIAESISEYNG